MEKRPFVGILFRCCNVYGRAYLKRDGSAYDARCPKCYRLVRLTVSKEGSDSRFFSAG